MKLDSIDRAVILKNSILVLNDWYPGNSHLWVAVRDLCEVGPVLAREICLELGWLPDMELQEFVQEQL